MSKQAENLKPIQRLPGMKTFAPEIRWGNEYKSWSIRKRLRHAERLASTMNHAADILQKERNQLLERMNKQELQLKDAKISLQRQGQLIQTQLAANDLEKQGLYKQIVDLSNEVKRLKRELETNGA